MPKSQPLLVEIGEGLSLFMGLPTLTSWSTSERPKNAKPGTFGFNKDTSSLEYYDGTSWFEAVMTDV